MCWAGFRLESRQGGVVRTMPGSGNPTARTSPLTSPGPILVAPLEVFRDALAIPFVVSRGPILRSDALGISVTSKLRPQRVTPHRSEMSGKTRGRNQPIESSPRPGRSRHHFVDGFGDNILISECC